MAQEGSKLQLKDSLGKILRSVEKSAFKPDYDASYPEIFGAFTAEFFGWRGFDIAESAIEALIDANHHELADRFRNALNAQIDKENHVAERLKHWDVKNDN